jgi:hypothetical protein
MLPLAGSSKHTLPALTPAADHFSSSFLRLFATTRNLKSVVRTALAIGLRGGVEQRVSSFRGMPGIELLDLIQSRLKQRQFDLYSFFFNSWSCSRIKRSMSPDMLMSLVDLAFPVVERSQEAQSVLARTL